MRAIFFRRFGYCVSIASLLGLTSLFSGPARLPGSSEVALAASDPVIAAAGDIACDPTNSSFNNGNGTSGSCRPKYTSDLLVNAGLAAVLALGDNQYYCGGYQAYLQSYDLSWGRVKSITRPAVGNHEYLTSGGTDCTSANSGAAGYFNYFGSAAGSPSQGYYSFDVGTWHLIAINSNCSSAGGCSSSSPQGQWLAADLAAHTNFCTLAYWHIPLYSSGGRANANTQSIWQTLYNNNVDVVLNGHDHIYERFAPQTPSGTVDTARGIREFIIGSGGANHTSLATIAANSEVRNVDTFGILKLTLHPTSYDWQFVPEAGKTFTDTGTGNCHGTASSGTPLPTATITKTSTSTLTPSSTATFTKTATSTIGPSPTRTPTATNTATSTLTPSSTTTATQTATGTSTIGPSPTRTLTATNTVTSTLTPSPISAATQTATGTSTIGPSPTRTSTTTNTPLAIPSSSATSTSTSSPTAAPTTSPTSSVSNFTFAVEADARVKQISPTSNYGALSYVSVDGAPDPMEESYLLFTVDGLSGPIQNAKLRVFVLTDTTKNGPAVYLANNSWTESGMTWNTKPALLSGPSDNKGALTANTWVEYDVSSLLSGNGTYTFALIADSSDGADFSSREGGSPAQLVITSATATQP
jgi:calcineurin-like phosphoesterase family protein